MKRERLKDPCNMTHAEAEAEYEEWSQITKATHRGRSVEGRLQMLHDQMELTSDPEYDKLMRDQHSKPTIEIAIPRRAGMSMFSAEIALAEIKKKKEGK